MNPILANYIQSFSSEEKKEQEIHYLILGLVEKHFGS